MRRCRTICLLSILLVGLAASGIALAQFPGVPPPKLRAGTLPVDKASMGRGAAIKPAMVVPNGSLPIYP